MYFLYYPTNHIVMLTVLFIQKPLAFFYPLQQFVWDKFARTHWINLQSQHHTFSTFCKSHPLPMHPYPYHSQSSSQNIFMSGLRYSQLSKYGSNPIPQKGGWGGQNWEGKIIDQPLPTSSFHSALMRLISNSSSVEMCGLDGCMRCFKIVGGS